jgi:hypothetical protein
MTETPVSRKQIRYIQSQIPAFDVPPYSGQRYEAFVPDTLDWQERAALAVNGLTGPADPEADYEVFWHVHMHGDRPVAVHDNNDQIQNEMQQSLVLMRLVSGSDLNEVVDQHWMAMLLHMQGPDGLLYYPVAGRPWQAQGIDNPQYGGLPPGDYVTGPYNNGEVLGAVALYYLRSHDPVWKELGMRVVDGLARLGVDCGDTIYYPKGMYALGERSDQAAPIPEPWKNIALGWMAQGILQFGTATGYEPALDLAARLIRFVRYHARMYNAEGGWLPDREDGTTTTHFHAHTYPLIGMLEYALLTGDRSLVDFVRTGYEFGKQHGETLIGFFPENVRTARRQTSELCEVGDMIGLALKLSAAGAGDYWDDADRWIRNLFAEGQLTRYDWMARAGRSQPHVPLDLVSQTDDRVGERCLGAFGGWPTPNDFFGARLNGHNSLFMHCCTANGARTIYYIWEHILHYAGNKLRVNLLLNRASPWADVDSHIPYQGVVDVRVKQPIDLDIRIPEWVAPAAASAQVNGQARSLDWDGRYARVGAVKPGDTATLTFPIAGRTDHVWVEKEPYTLVRKGNDVVLVDPPGRYAPLFLRDHYRENNTRWHKVQRFVSEENIAW